MTSDRCIACGQIVPFGAECIHGAKRPEARTQAKHTQTPWMVAGTTVYALEHEGWHKGVERFRNRFSAGVQGPFASAEELEANAAYIVRAVNAHDKLVSTLEAVLRRLESAGPDAFTGSQEIIRAALSAAKE